MYSYPMDKGKGRLFDDVTTATAMDENIQDHCRTKLIPIVCRFVPRDQWLKTHVDPDWCIRQIKQWLLSRCLPNFTLPPTFRPSSPVTFAAAPHNSSSDDEDGDAGYDSVLDDDLDDYYGGGGGGRSTSTFDETRSFLDISTESMRAEGDDAEDMWGVHAMDDDVVTLSPFRRKKGGKRKKKKIKKRRPSSPGGGGGGGGGGPSSSLAEQMTKRYDLYSFSEGYKLEDHCQFKWYRIPPNSLIEIHPARGYVRLNPDPEIYVLPRFQETLLVWCTFNGFSGPGMGTGSTGHQFQYQGVALGAGGGGKKEKEKSEWRSRIVKIEDGFFSIWVPPPDVELGVVAGGKEREKERDREGATLVYKVPCTDIQELGDGSSDGLGVGAGLGLKGNQRLLGGGGGGGSGKASPINGLRYVLAQFREGPTITMACENDESDRTFSHLLRILHRMHPDPTISLKTSFIHSFTQMPIFARPPKRGSTDSSPSSSTSSLVLHESAYHTPPSTPPKDLRPDRGVEYPEWRMAVLKRARDVGKGHRIGFSTPKGDKELLTFFKEVKEGKWKVRDFVEGRCRVPSERLGGGVDEEVEVEVGEEEDEPSEAEWENWTTDLERQKTNCHQRALEILLRRRDMEDGGGGGGVDEESRWAGGATKNTVGGGGGMAVGILGVMGTGTPPRSFSAVASSASTSSAVASTSTTSISSSTAISYAAVTQSSSPRRSTSTATTTSLRKRSISSGIISSSSPSSPPGISSPYRPSTSSSSRTAYHSRSVGEVPYPSSASIPISPAHTISISSAKTSPAKSIITTTTTPSPPPPSPSPSHHHHHQRTRTLSRRRSENQLHHQHSGGSQSISVLPMTPTVPLIPAASSWTTASSSKTKEKKKKKNEGIAGDNNNNNNNSSGSRNNGSGGGGGGQGHTSSGRFSRDLNGFSVKGFSKRFERTLDGALDFVDGK